VRALHLNLAARPYRDYRPLYAVVVAVSLAIFFLMLNNVQTGVRYLRETKATRTRIDNIEKQAANEEQRARDLQQKLDAVDVKQLALQARFANTQIAARAFSWSELLDRLEHVLPDDVRIQSVTPGFGKDGSVHLNMDMWGKSGDSMVRTLDRLDRDPHFASPFPSAEEHNDAGYHFGMFVEYEPSIPRVVE